MAAGGDVIQSFLVSLGFDIDESSLRLFNDNIQKAAKSITTLYASVVGLAAGVVYAFSKVSEGFEEMGYQYHIIAPAINKAIVLRQELIKAYSAAGINIRKTIVDSIHLNLSLTKTRYAFEAIYKSVASRFFGVLQKQSDLLRKKLYDNMPKIISGLTRLIEGVLVAFGWAARLGERVWSVMTRIYRVFEDLDNATGGWSTAILGAVAAVKLLNLEFLATPLGLLLALGLAILVLYDDFMTWKEGGQSLINWGSDFTKMIVGIIAIVGSLVAGLYAVRGAIAAWQGIQAIVGILKNFNLVLATTEAILAVMEAPIWAIVAAVAALVAGLTIADEKWHIFGGGLAGFAGKIGGGALGLLGGGSPLGSAGSNTNTNINANMQTQIAIQGSPNADATARAAAQQQGTVNMDFVRNLKGSTR